MSGSIAFFAAVLAISALMAARLVGFAWRRRVAGESGFLLMMSGVVVWLLTAFAEILLPSMAAKVWSSKIQYIGVATIAPAWLLFAVSYSGRTDRLSRLDRLLLWIPGLLVLALAMTNEWHGWVWPDIRPAPGAGPHAPMIYGHGPAVWFIVIYSALLMTAGAALIVHSALRAASQYRAQARLLIVASTLPVAANLAYMLGYMPVPGMDPTPIALAVSGWVVAWTVLRFDLLRRQPAAHAAVFEHLPDGALVFDADGRMTDINPRARELLGLAAGMPKAADFPPIGDQPLRLPTHAGESIEYVAHDPASDRHLRVTASAVALPGDRRRGLCSLVLLRDITAKLRSEQKTREEAEDRLRLVLAQLPAVVWMTRSDLVVETVIGTLPWTPSPVEPGRPISDRPLPLTPSLDIRAAHEVALHGEPITFTVTSDRAVHECLLRPRIGPDRRIDGVIGIALDVTARESARGEIRRLNDRLLLATRAAGIGLWEHDLVRDATDWDDTMHAIYGVDPSAAPGAAPRWMDYVHPDDRARVDRELAAATGAGKPLATDFRIVRPGGEIRHLRAAAAVQRDGTGHPLRMIGVNWDITGIRRAERDMARLAKAIEQSAEVTVITDPGGRIEYVNPAFERVTGYSRAEVIGQYPSLLKSGRHDEGFYRQLWETISSGRTWSGRFVNRRKDGTTYEEIASISPVFDDDGRIVNYVAEKRDVTQERLLEAQLIQSQKMESIGRLAGGVAHDFNNCLQAILGFAELLLQTKPESDPEREDLQQIQRAARHARDITGQLLSFSRRQMIQWKPVDLNSLIRDGERMLRRVLKEDIVFQLRLEPSAPPARGDPGLLQQVLMNLVVNASDAMPSGGRLTISTFTRLFTAADVTPGSETRPGRFVVLTVADTGTGISDEVRAHIFEPFFTTKERGKGTGLGLAVVHGIITQHQGWVHLYTEAGRGTEFKIFLPVAEGMEAASTQPAPPPPRGQGQTVLLVEDEPGARMAASRALRANGYAVTEAETVEGAMHAMGQATAPFDVLASDVVLPDGNGLDLALRMAETSPGTAVLLMSGYADERARWPDIRNRGYTFLQKPYPMAELLRAVAQVLSSRPRLS